jgi:hypothetical protein
MARRQSIPVHPRGRLVRLIPALFVALLPLTLFGQSPVQREATTTSWADGILKQEAYAVPPKDLADAVCNFRPTGRASSFRARLTIAIPTRSARSRSSTGSRSRPVRRPAFTRATTVLYLYPLEDHGPASKETLLDLWARWAAWLDKYVKSPKPTQQEQRKITTASESR